MGTETRFRLVGRRCIRGKGVKLNNPLMGTETILSLIERIFILYTVKLNNPLMGTETL